MIYLKAQQMIRFPRQPVRGRFGADGEPTAFTYRRFPGHSVVPVGEPVAPHIKTIESHVSLL